MRIIIDEKGFTLLPIKYLCVEPSPVLLARELSYAVQLGAQTTRGVSCRIMGNVTVGRAQATQADLRTKLLEYVPQQRTPVVFHEMIGTGKFLKCLHCKCESGGSVVVKVYLTHDPDQDLKPFEEMLRAMSRGLSLERQPNLLPYQEWQQSGVSNAAFLVRQYLSSSLVDRMATRPFLTSTEKRWLAFQLLKALEQLHGAGFCHGDIKPENVMVTSWNWLLLSDMAPFKPTYMPEDDPADYGFFFSGGSSEQKTSRKSCCVAPERFFSARGILPVLMDSTLSLDAAEVQLDGMYDGAGLADDGAVDTGMIAAAAAGGGYQRGTRPEGMLRPSMDLFSAGCVVAELFGGDSMAEFFDLPALLRFRKVSGSLLPLFFDHGAPPPPYIQPALIHMVLSLL